MAEFSERLKQLRIAIGYSQQKLADLLDVSKSTINMYERGERKPGIDLLEAIADCFNVDMDYLSGKSNIPRKTLIGTEQPPANIDAYNPAERNLIVRYRKLDSYGQDAVNVLVDAELKRCTEQAKIKSFRAAHSADNHEPEIVEMEDLSKYPESDIDGI